LPQRNPATPLSTNRHLLQWVKKMAELCESRPFFWIDGSTKEYDARCGQLRKEMISEREL
jgi:phosphoenolpyruvate carboxykinase (GTP)